MTTALSPPARRRRRPRRGAAGFTLTELMVAISGGLFISMAVFVLARDGARFYQNESRVADATLGALTGFSRLRGDVARAGFLTTPNIRLDPKRCGPVAADVDKLASLRIEQNGSPNATALSDNGEDPDSILLMGSFSAAEEFAIWGVTPVAAGYEVYLQANIGPLARNGYINLSAALQRELLLSYFKSSRLLRIQNEAGAIQFGTIADVREGPSPAVILSGTPGLVLRANNEGCGLKDNELGIVNPVEIIRYQVRSMSSSAAYAPLFTGGGPVGEAGRTELVRDEMSLAGGSFSPIVGTEEVVAEYAVRLQFGVTVVTALLNGVPNEIQRFEPGDSTVETWAGPLESSSNPQRVLAVRARLGVRSQIGDRDANINATGIPGVPAGLYRFGLGPGGTAPFARVRNVDADVALHNHTGLAF